MTAPDPTAGAGAWVEWAASLDAPNVKKGKESAYVSPVRTAEEEATRRQALRKLRGVERIPQEKPPEVEEIPELVSKERQDRAREKFLSSQLYKNKKIPNVPEGQTLLESSPIAIQFPLERRVLDGFMEAGRLKNLFETGTGKGSKDKNQRKSIESKVLNIPEDASDPSRPVYGALHVNKTRNTPDWYQGAAPSYGDAWIELKPEVKQRATYSNGDSFFSETVIPNEYINQFGSIEAVDRDYIEAQIHGGVHFGRDVQAIHVPEYAVKNNAAEFSQLRQIAKRYKVPVVVHGQDILGNIKAFTFTPDMK